MRPDAAASGLSSGLFVHHLLRTLITFDLHIIHGFVNRIILKKTKFEKLII